MPIKSHLKWNTRLLFIPYVSFSIKHTLLHFQLLLLTYFLVQVSFFLKDLNNPQQSVIRHWQIRECAGWIIEVLLYLVFCVDPCNSIFVYWFSLWQILNLNPKEDYNVHFPYKRGDLNVHPGVGGSVSAIIANLEAIWCWALENLLNINLKELKVFLINK